MRTARENNTVTIAASSIWHGTGTTYFQMPESVALNLKLLKELNGDALTLYVYLSALAQKESSVVIKLTATNIRALGIAKNAVAKAAGNLHALGLVLLTRTMGHDGAFKFELLDPETRLPLSPLHERRKELSAGDLTREQLTNYFLHRLGDRFLMTDENGINARCPFHLDTKHTGSLSIKLPASRGSAALKCFDKECPYHEGANIVEFEVAMCQLDGKRISATTAWERIRHIVKATEREELLRRQALEAVQGEL
jgi:hypothetical protein